MRHGLIGRSVVGCSETELGYLCRGAPRQTGLVRLRQVRAMRECLGTFAGLLPEGQGQNVAVTVLCVPSSPDSLRHDALAGVPRISKRAMLCGLCFELQHLEAAKACDLNAFLKNFKFTQESLNITHQDCCVQ